MTDESFNSPKLCCLKEMLVSKNKEKSLCGENNKSAALLGYLDMGKCRPALHLHPRKKSNELKINKMKVINTTISQHPALHRTTAVLIPCGESISIQCWAALFRLASVALWVGYCLSFVVGLLVGCHASI